jgi:DNA helicase II / ATP-dependent DNA helicase PcrA
MYSTLSEKQKEIVFTNKRKIVVRACPGSGKTYSVAAKLHRELLMWRSKYCGIATLSFTNTAWKEIENKLTGDFKFKGSVEYPHFLGTLDSFINKFIFLQFGHLLMGCSKRPVMVGAPFNNWVGNFFSESFFDKITYNIKGEIDSYVTINVKNWRENKAIVNAKEGLLKVGYANQNDANYFTMKLLEKYPQIARAIATRFPFVIIDEAQDISEIQMKIIDLLIKNGVKKICLVGDPDQSIFEWHNAKPDLFLKKCKEWGGNLIILNENRRSSKKICEFTYKLSSLSNQSRAVCRDVCGFDFKPEVWGYKDDDYSGVIADFLKVCETNGIPVDKKVAVLSRSKGVVCKICGTQDFQDGVSCWGDYHFLKDLCFGKHLYESKEFKKGFNFVEKGLYKLLKNKKNCTEECLNQIILEVGFINWRKRVFKLLSLLPTTNGCVVDWIKSTSIVLCGLGYLSARIAVRPAYVDVKIKDIFVSGAELNNFPYRMGTIHSVKGETFEAVLLILKNKGVGKYYVSLINDNAKIEDEEELRIVYVGITRPRRILVLAVPEVAKDIWSQKLC